jgi:hypothetical protein
MSDDENDETILPPLGKYEFLKDPKRGVVVHEDDGTYSGQTYYLDNPSDWEAYRHPNSLFFFQFGVVGTTNVLVWQKADHIDSALEEAAGWLESHAPGDLSDLAEEYKYALKEAREELGEDADEEELEEKAREIAEADMTYTESGWLTSYEWFVNELFDGELFEAALYVSKALEAASNHAYDMIPVLPLGKGDGERIELEEDDVLKMFADESLGLTSDDVQKIIALEEEQSVDLKGFKLERVK